MNIRLLVFTNNPVSQNNSNGRTVLNMIKNKCLDIYNVFVNGNITDLDKEITYYRYTDKDAVYAFFCKKNKPSFIEVKNTEKEDDNHTGGGSNKRTPFKTFIRNIVWSSKRILNSFVSLVREISPDLILYQLGDSAFLNNLVCKVSKRTNIKFITFNSEDYYFKTWNYLTRKKSLFFNLIKKQFDKSFVKVMSYSSFNIFLTEDLKELYATKFQSNNFDVIYNSSNISYDSQQSIDEKLFIYSGNLGVGRTDSLIKIGNILSEINGNYKLTVFSLNTDPKKNAIMLQNKNIIFKGAVSYMENVVVTSKARLVFCVESTEEFYIKDTCHAFSTKIADLLALKKNVVVFAPRTTTVYKYFDSNNIGYVSYDEESLKKCIRKAILDCERNPFFERQKAVFDRNHNAEKNSSKFLEIANSVVAKDKKQ